MSNPRANLYVKVFIAAALLRIVAALAYHQPNQSVDSWGYDLMARNLLSSGMISAKIEPPHVPSGYREPGYPAFLAGCYWVIGVHPMGAVVIQSTLGAVGTVLFVMLVVRLTGMTSRWLVWAAMLVALATPWISSTGWAELMREDLLHSLLLGTILLADWLARRKRASWAQAAALGAMVGVGMLIKATFAVLLPVIVIVWLAVMRHRAILPVAVAAVMAGAVIAPWLARNYALFGQPALACTKGLILYQHSGQPDRTDGVEPKYRQLAHALAGQWPDVGRYSPPAGYSLDTHDGWTHFCHVFWQIIVDRDGLKPEEADAVLYRIAAQDARRDPGRYLAITASNISFYLTGGLAGGKPRPHEVVSKRPVFRRAFHALRPAAIIVLEALAVVGMTMFRRSLLAWMVILTAGGTILANSVVSAGHWRYRATVDVLLAVLAVAVLARFVGFRRSVPPPVCPDADHGTGATSTRLPCQGN